MKDGQVVRQGSMEDIWEVDPDLYTIWKQTSSVITDAESAPGEEDGEAAEERRRLQRLVEEKRLELAKEIDVTGLCRRKNDIMEKKLLHFIEFLLVN